MQEMALASQSHGGADAEGAACALPQPLQGLSVEGRAERPERTPDQGHRLPVCHCPVPSQVWDSCYEVVS